MKYANDNNALTFISMFSGIEAASQAFPQWKPICFAEIERFPSAVLAHHYPGVPNVGDMTQHDWAKYRGKVDIVCGGPPCQAFSIAGLRNSMADARGNLSLAYMRALHAIRPRNAIVENVPGWLSTKDNAFGCFLAGLVGADSAIEPIGRWPNAGMVAGPEGRAAWRVLDAQYFGLAQRRRRVVVVADFGNGADPAAVLFEREGVQRHTPPSREKGEDVAGTATEGFGSSGDNRIAFALGSHAGAADGDQTNRSHAGGGPVGSGISEELAYSLRAGRTQAVGYAPEIARCVATREGSSQDYETTTMLAVSVTGEVAHTLKAEGADASEDGTGRGTPIIAFSAKDYGGDAQVDLSPTLRAGGHSSSHANAGVMPAITVAIRGREGGATAELGDEVATALRASQGDGDKPHVLAFHENQRAEISLRDTAWTLGVGGGKPGQGYPAALVHSAVRRLTPVECERLQGFPDNYTRIPWRGKPAEECPDGPRYKALGNSWAVPMFAWIGRRIDMLMPANDNREKAIADAA